MYSGYFEQSGLGVTAQNELKCELALSLKKEFPNFKAKNIYMALDINSDALTYHVAHRQGVQKDVKYQPVIELLLILQKRSGYKLGKRHMTALLHRLNVNLCVPVVRRPMIGHDILPIRKHKLPPLHTFSKKDVTDIPDFVKRNFNPEEQGVLLTTDVSQFNIGEIPVYLSAFVDLFNNEIVFYGSSKSPDLNLCFKSLEVALPFRNTETKQVIHHSDNGSQYHYFAYK